MRRPPAVAGSFYSAQSEALKAEVARLLSLAPEPQVVKAVVSPHAGMGYTGVGAGAMYARIDCLAVFLMLGPNHRGMGGPLALMGDGEWEMHLGTRALDRKVATTLRSACPLILDDPVAPAREHSLEMQLLFLQRLGASLQIAPLVLGIVPYEVCQELARAIAHTVRRTDCPVVVVASTDMTHCGHDYRPLPPAAMTAQMLAYQED